MKLTGLLIALMILTGCGSASLTPSLGPTPTATAASQLEPTATPSPAPTQSPSQKSLPESVTVTFRLTLDGQPPADAAFALESGTETGGGAIYLCSYYGDWPICEAGATYQDVHAFEPGTLVHYRFWRELDPNGIDDEVFDQGELLIGATDEVVGVTYTFNGTH